MENKFKVGDRVVIAYPDADTLADGLLGASFVYGGLREAYNRLVVTPFDDTSIVSFVELEYEYIWNSPLMKALRES